jgi:hypothetical protein
MIESNKTTTAEKSPTPCNCNRHWIPGTINEQ